jgi:hypothetical protein
VAGPPGPQGATGATGPIGPTGASGATGPSGTLVAHTSDGSTQYKLQKLVTVSNASRSTDTTISDTTGVIGIAQTTQPAGNSVDVIMGAQSLCVFDGGTTAGNYVQASTSAAGACHDAGANYPGSGQIIGRILSTNAGAGTYMVDLFGPEKRGAENALTFNSPLSRSSDAINCFPPAK